MITLFDGVGQNREVAACAICGLGEQRYLFTAQGFPVVRCTNCGLVFVSPRLTADAVQGIYEHAEYLDWENRLDELEANLAQRLDVVQQYQPAGKLLDVGAGQGICLRLARARGFDATGTEISATWGERAREHSGCPVFIGDVRDLDFAEMRFNVITLWHVLEHLRDPAGILLRLRELAADDGVLAVETPNYASLGQWSRRTQLRLLRHTGDGWRHFNPAEHFYHYTLRTLCRLLTKCGWQPFHRTTLSGPLQTGDIPWRHRLLIGTGLGNRLFVLARPTPVSGGRESHSRRSASPADGEPA